MVRKYLQFKSQSGVALITVLLIVALLTTIIAYAFESQLLTVNRVTNQVMSEQSYQLAIGGEQWALSLLFNDLENQNTAKTDHQSEPWNDIQETVKVDVGEIKVELQDLSGKINLNSLFLDKKSLSNNVSNSNSSAPSSPRVTPLAGTNAPTVTGTNTPNNNLPVEFTSAVWILNNLMLALEEDTRLVGNLIDWLDTDNSDAALKDPKTGRPLYIGGAEDFHYTGLEKPYRASNQKLKSLGELRFVKGFNEKIIKKLEPFVVVLPTNQLKININTAPEEVLLSMSNEPLSPPTTMTQVLEGQQLPLGHETTDIIVTGAQNAGWMPNVAQVIDVKSAFFRVTSKASFDKLSYSIASMLYRDFELGADDRPKPAQVVLRERKIL